MLTAAELTSGLGAAWRVLVGRPQPLAGLDLDVRGFWRSFLAPLLGLPAYALHLVAERRILMEEMADGATIDTTLLVAARAVSFLADLAALPVLLALVAGPLGIARSYVPLVVIFNWTSPLLAVPLALPAILFGMGAIGPEGAAFLMLLALMLAVTWRFRAARAALDNAVAVAAGVVAIDFLMSMVLVRAISRLFGL